MLGLIGTGTQDHHLEGFDQDPHIQPQAPVAHIVRIQGNAFLIGGLAAPADLPESGDARTYLQVQLEEITILGGFTINDGARSDQAHGSIQNIEQLG